MAKLVEYDVEGEEEGGGGTGVKVKPGVHVARIARCVYRDKKRDGSPANDLEIALDVGSEYDWVFTYVGLSEASKWKMAELVRALGLKEKGKIDPDKLVDKIIRVKINSGDYNGEYSPDAGKLFKAQNGDEALVGQGVSETSTHAGDAPEPDDTAEGSAEGGFEPSRETDPDIGSYDDWADEDLTAEAEDRNLTLPGGRGSKRDKAIKALRDDDNSSADAGEPEDAGTATGDDDYDEWELDKLKQEWTDRQLGDLPNLRGKNAAERVKTAIIEELRKDDAENPFEA